jgi:cysteine desulfurase
VALKDVALSSGSACASASPEPSHVLRALGLPPDLARAALRFGIGRSNTAEEIDWVADRLIEQVRKGRRERARGPRRIPTQ